MTVRINEEDTKMKVNGFLQAANSFQLNEEQQEAEIRRQEFVNRFTRAAIASMKVDSYALGRGDNDSFCYHIETSLNAIGNMHGATASKFGVYYGKENKLIWTDWTGHSFDRIRSELLSLYDAGGRDDLGTIENNKLSPMFKGKILCVYYPERYLNVFARRHLEFFLGQLDISYNVHDSEVTLRKLLIDYEKSQLIFSGWSAIKFGYCLYSFFGAPTDSEIEDGEDVSEEEADTSERVCVNRLIRTSSLIKSYQDMKVPKAAKITTESGTRYVRDPQKAYRALHDAGYACEIDSSHPTFLRRGSSLPYTEPHHLVPMSRQDDFEFSLDVPANIVSLCSNCHNWIHYGADNKKLLEKLYEERSERLKKVGIDITIEQLLSYY